MCVEKRETESSRPRLVEEVTGRSCRSDRFRGRAVLADRSTSKREEDRLVRAPVVYRRDDVTLSRGLIAVDTDQIPLAAGFEVCLDVKVSSAMPGVSLQGLTTLSSRSLETPNSIMGATLSGNSANRSAFDIVLVRKRNVSGVKLQSPVSTLAKAIPIGTGC